MGRFATGPTPDNEWVEDSGPHIMILVPDPASLEGIGDDPSRSGPYVMWKGTPYVHLMVPTVPRDWSVAGRGPGAPGPRIVVNGARW